MQSPCLLTALALAPLAIAQDPTPPAGGTWPGYRGPQADGIARGATPPLRWSDDENVVWTTPLPGPGASCPIVDGGRVFVTCWTGYAVDLDEPGAPTDLRHHLVCVDDASGKVLWDRSVPSGRTEEARQVQLQEHGFASPTPVTDGEAIYAYFGKTGVVAFDHDGEIRWRAALGTFATMDDKQPRPEDRADLPTLRWGAAASPVLHGDLVIVNASEESDSIRALDRRTGELVWKRESALLEGSAMTPAVFRTEQGTDVLVVVVGGEVWGLDPATGALHWTVETKTRGGMAPSPVARDGVVFALGGGGDGFAIRLAPELDGADRVVWHGSNTDIPSPVLASDRLLLVQQSGIGLAVDPRTGDAGAPIRLPGRTGKVYAAPLVADGRLYVVSRERGTFVYSADGAFELLATNVLASDDSRFDAAPAAVGDRLYLRSQKRLYCIADRSR